MWSNRNSHSLPVRMQNATATLEYSLVISYKTKHTLSIWPSNRAPWYLPKGVESLCPHKNLLLGAYSNFIHHCQNWEQPRWPSVDEWINKLWYIQTMECYLVLKRKDLWRSSHDQTWRNLKCILLNERSQFAKTTHCMIPSIWLPGRCKTTGIA